jgi:ureidoglycolate lyase
MHNAGMDIDPGQIAYTPSTGVRRVHDTPLVRASDESLAGYGCLVDDPQAAAEGSGRRRERALIWRANYHPDGGQLFYPLHGHDFVVPLALPGDDVTPGKFVSFWCDGRRGLYLHPNVWHGAIVPLDDAAEFLDRQGRVHARVSVNFVEEFGCYLGAPLRAP